MDRLELRAHTSEGALTGPAGGPYEPGCEAFDYSAADSIDLTDFAAFQKTFTGGP